MPFPRQHSIAWVFLVLGIGVVGCARDRRQITPTTSGTDLRNMPRGRMIPLPFPGSSLARAAKPKADPLHPESLGHTDPAVITTILEESVVR